MASERELRTEFRRALDEVLPPAPSLPAAVTQALREHRAGRSLHRGASKSLWTGLAWPRTARLLAEGAIAVVLAVAVAAVVLDLHHFTTASGPASTESIPAYIAMVTRDYARQDQARNANLQYCWTLDSVCPAPGRPVVAALQQWLDDLSRFAPPAGFVVIDAQLRRHLVANISDLNAMVAAYQARDQNGLDRAYNAALNQRYWFDAVTGSIVLSRPATASAYIDSVRSMKQRLGACVSCQSLASTSQVDCPSVDASSCQTDVAAATSTIAALEAELVRIGPPDALSVRATQLQEDLAQADTALLAMADAELTNDQTGFNSARLSLQHAWPAIDADIAAIMSS